MLYFYNRAQSRLLHVLSQITCNKAIIRFKEYYGMSRGHSISNYTRFLGGKENFNVYFSGKRRSLLNPKTAQCFFFFSLQSFGSKKARVNNDASISDRAHAP